MQSQLLTINGRFCRIGFSHVCLQCELTHWTHWGWDKMAAISQTTLSNAFSWMKMLIFWLRFHWSLFLRVKFTIFQYWLRWWLGAVQATSHYLNQCWLVYWRIYASLGLNEVRLHDAHICWQAGWSFPTMSCHQPVKHQAIIQNQCCIIKTKKTLRKWIVYFFIYFFKIKAVSFKKMHWIVYLQYVHHFVQGSMC